MPKKTKASVLPTLARWGGHSRVVRKAAVSELLDGAPDRIATELMDIGYSSVGDVFDWGEEAGSFRLKAKDKIAAGAMRSIKRIKVQRRVRQSDEGDATVIDENIEVEFHDKIAALRLMAQASGMLNKERNAGVPSITGIELKGPAVASSGAKPRKERPEHEAPDAEFGEGFADVIDPDFTFVGGDDAVSDQAEDEDDGDGGEQIDAEIDR